MDGRVHAAAGGDGTDNRKGSNAIDDAQTTASPLTLLPSALMPRRISRLFSRATAELTPAKEPKTACTTSLNAPASQGFVNKMGTNNSKRTNNSSASHGDQTRAVAAGTLPHNSSLNSLSSLGSSSTPQQQQQQQSYRMIDFFCVADRDSSSSSTSTSSSCLRIKQVFPEKSSFAPFLSRLCTLLEHMCDITSDAFSLVIPESGQIYYCAVMPINTVGSAGNQKKPSRTVLLPRYQMIFLISRVPCLSFMENALKTLVSLCRPELRCFVALGPFVRSLVYEIPITPTNRTVQLVWEHHPVFRRHLRVCVPRLKHLPSLDDRALRLLFSVCNPALVVTVFEHLLAEDCVVMHVLPSNVHKLAPVAEALRALLFPLVWQGVYLPFVPKSKWNVLQFSTSCIAGVCCHSASDFRLELLSNSTPQTRQKSITKRFLLLDIDSGQHEVVYREGDPTADAEDQQQQQPPSSLPMPLRQHLINHLSEITANVNELRHSAAAAAAAAVASGVNVSEAAPEPFGLGLGLGFSLDLPFVADNASRSNTAHNNTVSPANNLGGGGKQEIPNTDSSCMFNSSDSDESNSDDAIWIDWVRIAFLEVLLSLLSHLHFHFCDSSATAQDKQQQLQQQLQHQQQSHKSSVCASITVQPQSLHCSKSLDVSGGFAATAASTPSSPSFASMFGRKPARTLRAPVNGIFCSLAAAPQPEESAPICFDPEGFVFNLPVPWHDFARALVETQLFSNLTSQEQWTARKKADAASTGSSTSLSPSTDRSSSNSSSKKSVFRRLCTVWRNCSAKPVKRKMTPLLKKFQDVLNDSGYSFAASRLAVEQLRIFSPEEMNVLFTSVEKIHSTLDHMGVPRFLLDEDCMASGTNNTRTVKLRELLQRVRQNDKPPLVCTVSLGKNHPDIGSSWADDGDEGILFPALTPRLVAARTLATLPQLPFSPDSATAFGAKLSEFYLASAFSTDSNFGKTSALSAQTSTSVRKRTTPDKQAQAHRAHEWSETHAMQTNEDTTNSLLSHINSLQRALAEKNAQIKKLEATLLHLQGGKENDNADAKTQKTKDMRRTVSGSALQGTTFNQTVAAVRNENYTNNGMPVPVLLQRVKSSTSNNASTLLEESKQTDTDVPAFRRVERRQSPLFVDPARKESAPLGVVFLNSEPLKGSPPPCTPSTAKSTLSSSSSSSSLSSLTSTSSAYSATSMLSVSTGKRLRAYSSHPHIFSSSMTM